MLDIPNNTHHFRAHIHKHELVWDRVMSALHSAIASERPDNDRYLATDFITSRSLSQAFDRHASGQDWKQSLGVLQTASDINTFSLGMGETLLNTVCPAIEAADHEVIIVTCFWAKSASQQRLSASLRLLARKARLERRVVHVKICFSSLSLLQKLFHTQSLDGQHHAPQTWQSKFGLPPLEELLEGGVYGVMLSIKSIFIRPMSVMHPKFIIIDRQRVFLPSCNVSWENWFEGCISLEGNIIGQFLQFYQGVWDRNADNLLRDSNTPANDRGFSAHSNLGPLDSGAANSLIQSIKVEKKSVPSIFLPSPHHANPRFRPSSLLSAPEYPPTPLNVFLLTAINKAYKRIYMQTPNLTSPPVLSALESALRRGIDIQIVTSSRMMLLEQILTAGTITEFCVRSLIRKYRALVHQFEAHGTAAIEEGRAQPGRLSVRYYRPDERNVAAHEPVKSHLKLTIFDERIVVLGSGNMDRASWYTSQELGVAFFDQGLAGVVKTTVNQGLRGRLSVEQADSMKGKSDTGRRDSEPYV